MTDLDREVNSTSRGLTGRELLLGSSFNFTKLGTSGNPALAAWGKFVVSEFEAQELVDEGGVQLQSTVTTGILGVDAEWENWLAGVTLAVSEGSGGFEQPKLDSGTVESSLNSVNPYVRYQASDRLSYWGLFGYGTGDMTITQAAREERPEMITRTDISMQLGAAGARGVLLENEGTNLALSGDAFFVQTIAEGTPNLAATKADASRLRLALEGGHSFELDGGEVLTPSLEIGLRHDGGDAETGFGVEIGSRIGYSDTITGWSIETAFHKLILHEDDNYSEWGASGTVSLEPGASGRGPSFMLSSTWGTPTGANRLWASQDIIGLVSKDSGPEPQWGAEFGYGFMVSPGVLTPYFGIIKGDDLNNRLGLRWKVSHQASFDIEATRNDVERSSSLMFGGIVHW